MAYSPAVRSIVDTNNSTTVALGAGVTFTGTWTDVEVWNGITVHMSGTAATTAPGTVFIDFSHDGNTVHHSLTCTVASVADTPPRSSGTVGQYLRIRYTNGSEAQNTFSLQTMLHSSQVTTYLTDNSGALIVSDVTVEVALGNVPGFSNGTKFGSVLDIDSGDDPPTVWRAADGDRRGGAFARKTFATAASANVWVASTAIADQNIEITLVVNDDTNDLVTTTVATGGIDGTAPQTPTTAQPALDCNTAYLSGPNQTAQGDVWIMRSNNFGAGGAAAGEPSVGFEGDVLAFIPAGEGRTQQAVYRVPASSTMVVREVHAASAISTGNGRTSLKMRVKPPGGSWYTLRPYIMSTNFSLERPEIMAFAAGTLIEFFLESVANGTDTTVIFNYDLVREA
jgi:hypothetical protein